MDAPLWQPQRASLSNPSVPDEMGVPPAPQPVEGEAGKHMRRSALRVSAMSKRSGYPAGYPKQRYTGEPTHRQNTSGYDREVTKQLW